MSNIDKLLCTIREYNHNNDITDESGVVDKLISMINAKKHTKDDFFATEKAVVDFMKSDASEDDKQKVCEHTESLAMICNAIREGRVNV